MSVMTINEWDTQSIPRATALLGDHEYILLLMAPHTQDFFLGYGAIVLEED